MRELFSFIFDKLTDPLGLPIDVWKEWLILLVIGAIAYRIAFNIVGEMYDVGDISTGVGGSFFHWVIRFIVFVTMWTVTYGAIRAWQFCAAHWIAVISTVGGLLVCGIVGFIVYRNAKGGTQNA